MTNYLKDKKVYLAGPIHAVSDDGTGWRDYMTPKLKELFGLVVDDPCKKSATGFTEVKEDKKILKQLIADDKYQEVKEKFYPIVRKDLRSVDQADFLIAVYDPTIHMCGTIHELVVADQQKKPILLWINPDHSQDVNPWIFTFVKSTWIFRDWDKMIAYLKNVDNGIMDSSHWTL
jgi:nucleoside 2-deoxyribosyltransferase